MSTERDVAPHSIGIWRTTRAASLPGDVIRTSIMPPYDGPTQMQTGAWLAELAAALDEGIEIHCEECGSLRHGLAVLKALQLAVTHAEAEVAKREERARREVDEATAATDETFREGFKAGQDAADLAAKALRQRSQARERQRWKRERDAQEAAEADAAARRDPSHPAYITSAA